jgi:hypothetical protein
VTGAWCVNLNALITAAFNFAQTRKHTERTGEMLSASSAIKEFSD